MIHHQLPVIILYKYFMNIRDIQLGSWQWRSVECGHYMANWTCWDWLVIRRFSCYGINAPVKHGLNWLAMRWDLSFFVLVPVTWDTGSPYAVLWFITMCLFGSVLPLICSGCLLSYVWSVSSGLLLIRRMHCCSLSNFGSSSKMLVIRYL
jgi:hypothetical protein